MVNYARLVAVAGALPEGIEDNAQLASQFPGWSAEKIAAKTGIEQRHIATDDEYVSDLAIRAARKLLENSEVSSSEIDHVLVCTQAADFYMPVVATLVHDALGLRRDCGANDFNLGCSGFVYGLGLAKGLIGSDQAANVLLITTETYSKFLNPEDRSVRTIFGDGAAATLICGGGTPESLSGFVYGTDGSGATSLIVPHGGLRDASELAGGEASAPQARELAASRWDLYMDGPAIFNFTLRVVPRCVEEVMERAGIGEADVDLFVFHQANKFMLGHLAKKMKLPREKIFIAMRDVGNTVSASIPLALEDAISSGAIKPGMRVMFVGFGVGLSWAGAVCSL